MSKKDDASSSHDDKQDPEVGGHHHDLPVLTSDAPIAKELDIALALPGMTGVHSDDEVSKEESRRVRRKLDKVILPLLLTIYTLQYLDKSVIGSAAILGFLPDNHIGGEQLNNLGSFFYVGMLVSQWPHAYAMQRLPVAKYLGGMMILWSLFVGLHCVAGGYHGLIALRILLGFTEGCVTPGVMLICSMFYNRVEMAERVGWSFMCNGIAVILSGFIAFGVYHAPLKTPTNGVKVAQWQWFAIIIALMTFVAALFFIAFCPDSPTKARFLTEDEKVTVVKRIKENQSGVETKTWKWYQFKEALLDPKAYIFMLFAVLVNFVGGIGVQFSLIIKDFGFTILETTLLFIPSGATMVISITAAMIVLRWFPNSRTQISIASYFFPIICTILLLTLPNNRIGLLCAFYGLQLGNSPAMVLSLNWITTTTSGHTKKLTMHAMWFVGYSVGQLVSPQWWKDKYKPRNRVPWTILLVGYCSQCVILVGINYYFKAMNRARDEAAAIAKGEEADKYSEYGYVEIADKDASGGVRKVQVEKRFLDQTDKENLSFRYVL